MKETTKDLVVSYLIPNIQIHKQFLNRKTEKQI